MFCVEAWYVRFLKPLQHNTQLDQFHLLLKCFQKTSAAEASVCGKGLKQMTWKRSYLSGHNWELVLKRIMTSNASQSKYRSLNSETLNEAIHKFISKTYNYISIKDLVASLLHAPLISSICKINAGWMHRLDLRGCCWWQNACNVLYNLTFYQKRKQH